MKKIPGTSNIKRPKLFSGVAIWEVFVLTGLFFWFKL